MALKADVKKAARRFAVPKALAWFAAVLLIGGGLFSLLERGAEEESRRRLAAFLQRMRATLGNEDWHDLVHFLGRVDDRVAEEMVRANLTRKAHSAVLAPHDWDFTGSVFFCFTAATTIGYGNYTPTTDAGKAFLVLYALVAIPACLNAFAEISDRALELLGMLPHEKTSWEELVSR